MCIIWSVICMRSQSSRNELANGPYQSLYNFQRKKRRAGERYRQQMAPATLLFSFSLLHLSIYFLGCAHYYAIWYLVFSSSSSLSLFSPFFFFFLLIFARDIYNEGVQCAFYASYLTLHYFPSRSRRTLLLILSIFYYLMWIYIACQSVTHTHTQKMNRFSFSMNDYCWLLEKQAPPIYSRAVNQKWFQLLLFFSYIQRPVSL